MTRVAALKSLKSRRWGSRAQKAVLAACVSVGILGCGATEAGSSDPFDAVKDSVSVAPPSGGSFVVTAVGDIQPEGKSEHAEGTSKAAAEGDIILGLGDFQYQDGDLGDYNRWFDHSWGANVPKLYPVLAPNHDQYWRSGSDPITYFNGGGASGVRTPIELRGHSSYSFERGNWHFLAIDDSCFRDEDHCDPAELIDWVRRDLAAASAYRCTIAYWHQPYWTSPTKKHEAFTPIAPVVEELGRAGVDLVLSAHQHGYERFHPQAATGERDDDRGIRQFVVGTGGIGLYPYLGTAENSATKQSSAYGVLRLELGDSSYSWRFVRTSGGQYEDSGSAQCV